MRTRFVWITTLLTGAIMFGWTSWLQYKVDRTKAGINRIVEESRHCAQIRLMGTREDVLDAMGQPVKEEAVPSITGGMARRLWYRYSIKTDHDPYVDVDDHFRKIVAIDCAFSKHSLVTVLVKGRVELPKQEALPTSRQRY